MSARRPSTLRCGDRVRFRRGTYLVLRIVGTLVVLAQEFRRGEELAVHLADLQAAPDFTIIGTRPRPAMPPAGTLEALPAHVIAEARWWEQHLLEVIYGTAGPSRPGAESRPQYDPGHTTLTQREQAKAAELVAAGHQITAHRVKRQRQRYETGGLLSLVDGRTTRAASRTGRADPRVIDAMRAAIEETIPASTKTASYILWRTGQILTARHGQEAPAMPARTTGYRLFGRLADRHTLGSARTRRSLADQPQAPFSSLPVDAPGEVMQIDSTPLDVLVLLDNGVVGRVELTGMIDVATRTVTAAVLSPTTKSVDASVLLARTVTPEPMRPGWADALRMQRSVMPHQRLLELDERLAHAAAKPVIIPDTIVCDHGNVFLSHNFRASCRFLGINFQPTHEASGAEKPHIERMFASVGSLFAQFVSGYTGPNTERRGYKLDSQLLWSQLELQGLLDEWLVCAWQNRPHDGLRDPVTPGRMFTPNEKYAAMVEAAGYVPVALTGNDFIELLPATWRAINSYGVRINHRTYDAEGLNPLRKQPSGVTGKRHLWEIHHDPYDVSHAWVRNHWDGGWITLTWKHLHRAPIPFGELAWDHTRANLTADEATEAEIADAVQQLLVKASQGPQDPPGQKPSKRDKRVAARTAATAQPKFRPPAPDLRPDRSPHEETEPEDSDQGLAKVIPLGIFDAREEAKRWW